MKSNKGFTLIELVIILGLLGIVLPLIFSPVVFSMENIEIQSEKANITSTLRAAMDHLTRQIRGADAVEVTDGNTITIDSRVYKIESGNLTEDGTVVIAGVDRLFVSKAGKEISIEVAITDGKGKEHSLNSTINMR